MKMDPKWRRIDGHSSPNIPQSSDFTNFSEQARRASHMTPGIRHTQHEYFHDFLPHPQLHPQPRYNPHPGPYPAPQRHDTYELIQREIDKQRIREEIIAFEMARRRDLEAEVRREMMMVERELALDSNRDGFPFGSPPVMGFHSPVSLSLLGTSTERRSLEDRIASSVEEMQRLKRKCDTGRIETLPFQRGPADVRISEVQPVVEESKEKEKIILLAKPDINISGSKRKAMTPPGLDANELIPGNIMKKKAKEDWSCALCKVSTTSEQGLKEHVGGKKHKSKEAALGSQKAGKNYTIGLIPKKATKSIKIVRNVVPERECVAEIGDESLPCKETGEASSRKDGLPPLQENHLSDKLKKNKTEYVQKEGENADSKKEQYRHWCEICQIGTHSSKVMNNHKKGKKHLFRLGKSDQHCKAGPYNQKEKVTLVVNHAKEDIAEDEKTVTTETVDELVNEVSSGDPESKTALEHEDCVILDETKAEKGGALDDTKAEGGDANMTKPQDDVPFDEIKVEEGGALDETKAEEGGGANMIKPKDDVALVEFEVEGGRALDETKAEEGGMWMQLRQRMSQSVIEPNDDKLFV